MKSPFRSLKMSHDHLGIYVLALMVVAWLGFGPSYFNQLFIAEADFSLYFHFHAACMVLWVGMAFVQPVLIRYGKMQLHRKVGRISYLVFPIMIISILMLVHSQLKLADEIYGAALLIPFKDIMAMTFTYSLAIKFKHHAGRHARWMVATMIPMIEPSLIRLFFNYLPPSLVDHSYLLTILVVDGVILTCFLANWKRPQYRGIFLFLLAYMVGIQAIILTNATEQPWLVSFARWYASL